MDQQTILRVGPIINLIPVTIYRDGLIYYTASIDSQTTLKALRKIAILGYWVAFSLNNKVVPDNQEEEQVQNFLDQNNSLNVVEYVEQRKYPGTEVVRKSILKNHQGSLKDFRTEMSLDKQYKFVLNGKFVKKEDERFIAIFQLRRFRDVYTVNKKTIDDLKLKAFKIASQPEFSTLGDIVKNQSQFEDMEMLKSDQSNLYKQQKKIKQIQLQILSKLYSEFQQQEQYKKQQPQQQQKKRNNSAKQKKDQSQENPPIPQLEPEAQVFNKSGYQSRENNSSRVDDLNQNKWQIQQTQQNSSKKNNFPKPPINQEKIRESIQKQFNEFEYVQQAIKPQSQQEYSSPQTQNIKFKQSNHRSNELRNLDQQQGQIPRQYSNHKKKPYQNEEKKKKERKPAYVQGRTQIKQQNGITIYEYPKFELTNLEIAMAKVIIIIGQQGDDVEDFINHLLLFYLNIKTLTEESYYFVKKDELKQAPVVQYNFRFNHHEIPIILFVTNNINHLQSDSNIYKQLLDMVNKQNQTLHAILQIKNSQLGCVQSVEKRLQDQVRYFGKDSLKSTAVFLLENQSSDQEIGMANLVKEFVGKQGSSLRQQFFSFKLTKFGEVLFQARDENDLVSTCFKQLTQDMDKILKDMVSYVEPITQGLTIEQQKKRNRLNSFIQQNMEHFDMLIELFREDQKQASRENGSFVKIFKIFPSQYIDSEIDEYINCNNCNQTCYQKYGGRVVKNYLLNNQCISCSQHGCTMENHVKGEFRWIGRFVTEKMNDKIRKIIQQPSLKDKIVYFGIAQTTSLYNSLKMPLSQGGYQMTFSYDDFLTQIETMVHASGKIYNNDYIKRIKHEERQARTRFIQFIKDKDDISFTDYARTMVDKTYPEFRRERVEF